MARRPIVIWWIRRDLRLADNPALTAAVAAVAAGGAVLPVYILDPQEAALGAAPKFRLGLGLAQFDKALAQLGSRLILRRGDAATVLGDLTRETGAQAVYWSRLYDPQAIQRDSAIKTQLKGQGIDARSFGGRLLFEPWSVETKAGGPFKVFTPFWKSVRARTVEPLLPAPAQLPAPEQWPASEALSAWQMEAAMQRGAGVVAPHCQLGEAAAQERLEQFLDSRIQAYQQQRDLPAQEATSGLSENLAWGEISPQRIWHLGRGAMEQGAQGAETFLKELVWREFAYHLMYHTPHIVSSSWRPEWDAFPWQQQPSPALLAWQQGQTGYGLVDAAMRELYVTGRMHNRARMIGASFLTKHLMIHWKLGMDWFAQTLIDWDPASNAMGWQWVAGCGPDASPFFRIFNPDGQQQKFDPQHHYLHRWIAEGQSTPPAEALAFFDATPRAWGLTPDMPRAAPIIGLPQGRTRALEAYQHMRQSR